MCLTISEKEIDKMVDQIAQMSQAVQASGLRLIRASHTDIKFLYDRIDAVRNPESHTLYGTDWDLDPEDVREIELNAMEMRLESMGLVRLEEREPEARNLEEKNPTRKGGTHAE